MVGEEYGQVAKARIDRALAIFHFTELVAPRLEIFPQITLVLCEQIGVHFIVGLFARAIRAGHPDNADAVAVREKILCCSGVSCNAGGRKPVVILALVLFQSPLEGGTPLTDGVSDGEPFSLRSHWGSTRLLSVSNCTLVVP